MDTPIDNHYMTREFLETTLVQKQEAINALKEQNERYSQISSKWRNEAVTLRDSMQEWTLNELDNGQITESQAEEIAEICGFELSKEVEVEITVTYNLTVNVPHNSDVESIVGDIDFDTVSYNDEHISYMTSSVDRIDF
jgi:hypothetical protein